MGSDARACRRIRPGSLRRPQDALRPPAVGYIGLDASGVGEIDLNIWDYRFAKLNSDLELSLEPVWAADLTDLDLPVIEHSLEAAKSGLASPEKAISAVRFGISG